MSTYRCAPTPIASSAYLLLVDGRLPSGGYAHSGGIEAAVADLRVRDITELAQYLRGRLMTTGFSDAAVAAASCEGVATWQALCAEAAARCPSPALRRASHAEARGLLRVARSAWPSADLEALVADGAIEPMWPVALGAVARAAGAGPAEAALAAAQSSISGAAWAANRLLGLDPYRVGALLAHLAPDVDGVAARAAGTATVRPLSELPAFAAPLQEIAAELREQWEVHLFVS